MAKRIDQFLPSFVGRDAIGNHVMLIQEILREDGFESDVFCEMWSVATENSCQLFEKYPYAKDPDAIQIYHFSVGSWISNYLLGTAGKKISCYHNITPSDYFAHPKTRPAYLATRQGLRQVEIVKLMSKDVWTVSQYNADELTSFGFSTPKVFPVLRDYSRLTSVTPLETVTKGLANRKNIIFVGRVEPHKGHHDALFALAAYKKLFNETPRLIFVGNASPHYFNKLKSLAVELGLSISECFKSFSSPDFSADVLFAGSVSDAELATYYQSSDLFLCLSEHEGFCVPLVEAMSFGVPVVAHRSSAIPETLAEAGILLNKDDQDELVAAIHTCLHNHEFAAAQRELSKKRAATFEWSALKQKFKDVLAESLTNL